MLLPPPPPPNSNLLATATEFDTIFYYNHWHTGFNYLPCQSQSTIYNAKSLTPATVASVALAPARTMQMQAPAVAPAAASAEFTEPSPSWKMALQHYIMLSIFASIRPFQQGNANDVNCQF